MIDVPSTQEGLALVVPATCPGKHEHFTVCDRSSILFLLQHLWRATTSHVPVLTCWAENLNYENVTNNDSIEYKIKPTALNATRIVRI